MKNNLSLPEKAFTKAGTVLAVRAWQPATFFEVDLHLPQVNMLEWNEALHIKCRVAPYCYRDYTPAWWDAETHTCTLFIDAAHNGAGSNWVKTLQPDAPFYYAGTASSHQRPVKNARHIFLGDHTAVAHFAALHQLAGPAVQIQGAIAIPQRHHRYEFKQYLPKLPLAAVDDVGGWVRNINGDGDCVFYLAGNSNMVAALRKQLMASGFSNRQINAQGFWH